MTQTDAQTQVERAQELAARLAAVRGRMAGAAARSGRRAEDVTLVAVSKFHPASDIAALARAGQRHFGESYVQEALAKQQELTAHEGSLGGIIWHFLGGLQTKKARQVVGRFALVHSVDSEKLAHELARRAVDAGLNQDVLLEVNIGDEPQKAGIAPGALAELAELTASLRQERDGRTVGLNLRGLMCLPPQFDAPEAARPFFARLRLLRDDLETRLDLVLPELSMGMTGDFEAAIEEGATLVRIGTSIFGERPPKS